MQEAVQHLPLPAILRFHTDRKQRQVTIPPCNVVLLWVSLKWLWQPWKITFWALEQVQGFADFERGFAQGLLEKVETVEEEMKVLRAGQRSRPIIKTMERSVSFSKAQSAEEGRTKSYSLTDLLDPEYMHSSATTRRQSSSSGTGKSFQASEHRKGDAGSFKFDWKSSYQFEMIISTLIKRFMDSSEFRQALHVEAHHLPWRQNFAMTDNAVGDSMRAEDSQAGPSPSDLPGFSSYGFRHSAEASSEVLLLMLMLTQSPLLSFIADYQSTKPVCKIT